MFQKFCLPLLLSGLVIIACCKKDPPISQPASSGPSFSAVVDGVLFTSDPFSIDSISGQYLGAFASVVPGLASQYQLSVIGQKNNLNDTAHTSISLFTSAATVQSFSSSNPQSGTSFCLLSFAHGVDSAQQIWLTDSSSAHSGSVTIIKLDTINKLVSGTFSFTGYNHTGNPAMHIISQGTFTNVPIKP